jgi:hypothetical protein
MLDSTAPTSFAPEPEIAWRGVFNESPPPPGPRWIPGTAQAEQFSISTTTAVRDRVSSWVRDRAGQTERPSFPNALDIDLRRIQALRIEAEIDQVPFSNASYAEFRDFIRQVPVRTRPAIFLRDNGNLRALWKNENQEQIGLQFLGGGDVQYVILKRRPNRKLTTHSGVASSGELLALIRAVGVTALFG